VARIDRFSRARNEELLCISHFFENEGVKEDQAHLNWLVLKNNKLEQELSTFKNRFEKLEEILENIIASMLY